MGGSSSKNIAEVMSKVVVNMTTNIVQKNNNTVGQNNIIDIKVKGGSGDLVISDITQKQKASVDIQQVFKAMSTQESKQQLQEAIAQQAKSLTSGINLGNFSKSENITKNVMEALTNMATDIGQTCKSTNDQSQLVSIDVENRDGNILITGIEQGQIGNIISSCVQDTVNSNKNIQDLQLKLDQIAKAETKGFSIWALVVMMLLALLTFLAPVILGVGGVFYALSKFMFPIMMLAGIVLIAIYFTSKKDVMDMYQFSKPVSKIAGRSTVLENEKDLDQKSNADDANDACKSNKKCKAFYWQGLELDNFGKATKLDKPKTTYYSYVENNPSDNITTNLDNYKLLKLPKVYINKKDEIAHIIKPGEIVINPVTSECEQFNVTNDGSTIFKNLSQKYLDDDIQNQGSAQVKDRNIIIYLEDLDTPLPTKRIDNKGDDAGDLKIGDILIKYKSDHDPVFYLYKYEEKDDSTTDWKFQQELEIPGVFQLVPFEKDDKDRDIINSSGFKKSIKKYSPVYMWVGFALTFLGTFGTVYTFMTPHKKSSITSNIELQKK